MAEQWQRAEIPGPLRAITISKVEKIPPCKNECPIGNNTHEFLHLAKQGRFEEAARVLKETNPLPSVTGRVCYHLCEDACNRGKYDEPLGIRNVERFLGDLALEKPIKKKIAPSHLPRVAVVGSGPSGISCAYHLARLGYRVTVFEALPKVGGMLSIGIQSYRLPKDIVEREIATLSDALGIEIKTSQPIKDLNELREFDAVFLGTGATINVKLRIPNEEAEGVFSGINFLKAVNFGEKVEIGERVLVIGGGNTAMGCARTAIRMSCLVTILYRRTREEMPATAEEVEEALREGAKIEFLVAPKSILTEGNKVVGVECIRMRLGPPDETGRRRPIPIEGSEFKKEADAVIAAIGQKPNLSYLPKDVELERGYVKIDGFGQTSRPMIFAGGDASFGVSQRVADAIGSGMRAALAIDAYLKGEIPKTLEKPSVVESWEINKDYFTLKPRARMPQISLEESRKGFMEINLGYDRGTVTAEANRCFHCGLAIDIEDLNLVTSMIRAAENPIFTVGYDVTRVDLGNGVKPIDYIIRIAKAENIPVAATAQVVSEFLKRGFQAVAWMSAMDIGNRLTDPNWNISGKGKPHDLALIIGIPYYMGWVIESGLKSFAPNLKTISLDRYYQPNCNWSLPNLSIRDWRNALEKIVQKLKGD